VLCVEGRGAAAIGETDMGDVTLGGVLLLGLLVGMRHALEADHIAAVSCIVARERSVRRIVAHGAVWGLGHTLTLMVVAGGVLLFGRALAPQFAIWLEFAVGVMLVLLGGHLLVCLARERVHYHLHRHGDGTVHVHAHSHAGQGRPHDPIRHEHAHPAGLPVRTLLVGMTHGMAGSAALVVLAASAVGSPALGIAYVAVFGFGSVAGMAALSAVIAVPLARAAATLTWTGRALQGAIGLATLLLGMVVMFETAPMG